MIELLSVKIRNHHVKAKQKTFGFIRTILSEQKKKPEQTFLKATSASRALRAFTRDLIRLRLANPRESQSQYPSLPLASCVAKSAKSARERNGFRELTRIRARARCVASRYIYTYSI